MFENLSFVISFFLVRNAHYSSDIYPPIVSNINKSRDVIISEIYR